MHEKRRPQRPEHQTKQSRICASVVIILLSSLFFAACSPGPEKLARQKFDAELAWEEEVGRDVFQEPALAYVEDDPALPRVLLIGDSISMAYTIPVRNLLKGKANVHRIPKNGGNTLRGLENIETWLRDEKWDVIHFNWGLHDIYRVDKQNEPDIAMDKAVSPQAYAQNLLDLVARLKKNTNAKLIWASTTPVPDGAPGFIQGEEVKYNAIAETIMTKESVSVNDLHEQILPQIDTLQRQANVHFHAEGSTFLAQRVANIIQNALEAPD